MVHSRSLQVHLRSVVNFAMLSHISEAIQGWVRREIVDDDPWDEAALPFVVSIKSDRPNEIDSIMHNKR